MAPPVFKTGLSLLVGDGRFDSFPSPPNLRFFLSADGRNYLQLLNWRISERWSSRCAIAPTPCPTTRQKVAQYIALLSLLAKRLEQATRR